jgi:hypothetical protein
LGCNTQRAKLPNVPFLDNINNVLGFKATRHDLIVPLVFSQSFGTEEEVGAISYGVMYAHSFLSYGFEPRNVYNGPGSGSVADKIPSLPVAKQNFSSFGGFLNVKLGYRYAYVIPAVSVYYQNYGQYQLLNNVFLERRNLYPERRPAIPCTHRASVNKLLVNKLTYYEYPLRSARRRPRPCYAQQSGYWVSAGAGPQCVRSKQLTGLPNAGG